MTKALGIAQGHFGRAALLDMDTSLVGHAHHHCHMLLKVAGPDSSFVVEDRVLPMRDDTAILVNAWECHRYEHRPQAPRTLFLALYIEPSWIADVERSFAPRGQLSTFGRSCTTIEPELRSLAQRLAQYLAAGTEDIAREATQLISDMVLSTMHRHAERPSINSGPAQPRMQDYRIRRAVRMMRDSEMPVSLDWVAREIGLSRPRFNQLFRLCTGISPALYSNALRVERSVRSLGVKRHAVAAVSDQLGFSAQSNFSRFFTQHTGVTPGSFRRTVRVFDEALPG